MNKIIPIALALGLVLMLGCIGPGAQPKENQTAEQKLNKSLQEAERALNSATSQLQDLNLSGFTVEEGL